METARARRRPDPSAATDVEILIDPKKIETLAQKNSFADQAFASFLKTLDPKSVDAIVHEVAATVTAAIDCTACAKCCRALVIAPDYKDVSELASRTEMTTQDFKKKYMRLDTEGDLVFRQRPCPFLASQRCTVYESRPKLCRSYPYLDQPDFVGHLNRTLRNVHVCPIVFNTFERLKSDPRLKRDSPKAGHRDVPAR